jgi:hypothetical protein
MNAEALRPVSLKLDFAYQAEAAFKGALRALTSAENKVFEGRQASASRAGTPVRPAAKSVKIDFSGVFQHYRSKAVTGVAIFPGPGVPSERLGYSDSSAPIEPLSDSPATTTVLSRSGGVQADAISAKRFPPSALASSFYHPECPID